MSDRIEQIGTASPLMRRVWLFLSCLMVAAGTAAFVVGLLIRANHDSVLTAPASQDPAAVVIVSSTR